MTGFSKIRFSKLLVRRGNLFSVSDNWSVTFPETFLVGKGLRETSFLEPIQCIQSKNCVTIVYINSVQYRMERSNKKIFIQAMFP